MREWGPELAVVLGVVEGLTEYLPVSSTGHLILVGHVLGFSGDLAASVEISIQLGAILAVIVYERRKLASFLSDAAREQGALRPEIRAHRVEPRRPGLQGWAELLRRSTESYPNLWFLIGLGVAFLPAAVVGLIAHRWIEAYLFNPRAVAAALIAGGLIILVVEGMRPRVRFDQLHRIGVPTALWVGLAQCVSLVPGVSRSAATIIGGLLAGMDRKVATEYSFFLALPTLGAATTYKALKSHALMTGGDVLALGLGMVVSFLVAWAVIAAFLTFVTRHSLRVFAYYRILLGITVLLVFR
ncbi:MAG: undecaprenyl-diphosphate phosphatase [Nitrospiraceae bacterium]